MNPWLHFRRYAEDAANIEDETITELAKFYVSQKINPRIHCETWQQDHHALGDFLFFFFCKQREAGKTEQMALSTGPVLAENTKKEDNYINIK